MTIVPNFTSSLEKRFLNENVVFSLGDEWNSPYSLTVQVKKKFFF